MKNILIIALLSCVYLLAESQQEMTNLRVATYNLRMDTQSDSLNAWSYRKDNINALIRYHDFDIIGTQEGYSHQLSDICRLYDYTYFGAGRDDGREAGEHSAIVYKRERFEILESGNFWLREEPDKPGKGWDATCCNRICSWAKFRERATGKAFYFFNVHFDHQGVIARQESSKLMVNKIKEIAKDIPVICTGDFNSTPETQQIEVMSELLFDSRKISKTTPYGPEGTFNHRFSNPVTGNRIDYIFVSKNFTILKYATLTDNNGMHYPSDHLPVMVDICY